MRLALGSEVIGGLWMESHLRVPGGVNGEATSGGLKHCVFEGGRSFVSITKSWQ